MKKPQKWINLYPQGTVEGDEEQAFFLSLELDKWDWKTAEQIAVETKLSNSRVEEIINKYFPNQVVLQCPTDTSKWGYWERHKNLVKEIPKSIAKTDHQKRIDALLKSNEE